MTTTCNTNTSCDSGFPGSFEVNGSFVMNEGSTLNLNMCCDDDGNSGSGGSSSGTDKFPVSGALNASGHLILTMNDNTTIDCGLLSGSGNPVVSATINGSNELVLTLQDGTEINAGAIAGTAQNNGFILSDETMAADAVVGKTLSKTQTAYDLQAYALKQETAGAATSETVNASPDATQSVDQTQYLAATARGISSETSPSGSNIVQPMTGNSDNGNGQVASSYPPPQANWPAYKAFGHDDTGFFMSGSQLAADGSDPHWIQISFNEQKTIAAYRVSGRTDSINDKVIRFKLQGSNDDVNWIDIDDQSQADVIYDVDNGNWTDVMPVPTSTYTHFRLLLLANNPAGQTYPAVRELELLSSGDFTVTQYYNEFTPEFSNSMTIQATDSATSASKKILLETGDVNNYKYYSLPGGVLTEKTFNTVADIEANGFIPSGALDVSSLAPGFRILTLADEVTATSTVTGYVSEPASLFDMSSYDPLTSVQITAPVNTTVSVQNAPGSYVRWNGSAWIAIASVANGNTVAELNALTAVDWATLGGSSIGFGYFNSAETVASASALLGFGSGGSGSTEAWLLCDASEVRIRWYDNKVTFTAAEAGTYKLAYQDAV